MKEYDIIYGGSGTVKEKINKLSKKHETFKIEKALLGVNQLLTVIVSFIPYNND